MYNTKFLIKWIVQLYSSTFGWLFPKYIHLTLHRIHKNDSFWNKLYMRKIRKQEGMIAWYCSPWLWLNTEKRHLWLHVRFPSMNFLAFSLFDKAGTYFMYLASSNFSLAPLVPIQLTRWLVGLGSITANQIYLPCSQITYNSVMYMYRRY